MRIGHGYDVHRLVEGRDLILGGVKIEYEKGLQALTAEERNIHWHRCQEIIREDCPWIFTHITKNYTLVNKRVGNYQSHDFPYGQERHYRVSEK